MAQTIPNLWPTQIKVEVQSPYTILKVQAGLLGKVTKGILEGAVETEAAKQMVQHRLVIIAPAYNGYRHTLLTAIHHRDMPYPCEVRADALAEKVRNEEPLAAAIHPYKIVYPSAFNDDNMLALVRTALQSTQTQAALLSLIAKSNEARGAGEAPPPAAPAAGQETAEQG
jgi:hypothetical protein